MTQKTIHVFFTQIYSKPPKKKYNTDKTDVYHIDDIWSLDILHIKDYGPEKNRGYRQILVAIENFSKFGWTISLKNKNSQTITHSFENIPISSKRSPDLVETDHGKEIVNKIFTDLLNKNNIKRYSRYTSVAVFAERFNRTIRDLLKRPVFLKVDGNKVDISPTKTKRYNNRIHPFIKLTPIQRSLKKNERFVYQKLLGKRKKIKPENKIDDLVRTADLKRNFSKGDTTNWSY